MAKAGKRRIRAQDLYRFQRVLSCRISPDGTQVVYSLQRVDPKSEKKYSNLWVVPTGRGRPRQFTYGDQEDIHPRWSPDGKSVAFLSNREDEAQEQIYLIPTEGGEARPLTDLKGEFRGFEWSPDGRTLVCEFRKKDREVVEREKDERKKELGVVNRHITRIFYKYDGEGYLPAERRHIWTIDVRSRVARQLTDSAVFDERSPQWSPDGQHIVFCSNRSPDPDLDPDAVDLYVIPAAGGALTKIAAPFGEKKLPRYSPDGRWIAYVGREGRGEWWKNSNLWAVPVEATTPDQARNLTGAYDLHFDSYTINDMGPATLMPPTWSKDGQRLFFQVDRCGNTELQSVSLAGDDLQTVIGGDGVVGEYTLDQEHIRLAYFYGEMTDPGQVWVRDLCRGSSRQITQVNRNLLRALDLGEIETVWFKGASGNDLQGWILKPPGFDPGKKYASILEIHGGPLVQYGHFFMHEFFFLAAHDYVVYFCNPRGGRGYGEEHARAIWGAWGTADYDDLMAWTDHVAAKPYIDDQRMGVTGGSYGGYMTNWIIGHTRRFKAAVTQRCVSNLISLWGSSDLNWKFQQMFADRSPWEAMEQYWEMSPMKHIGNARTPTLVIHSENDYRCAIEQGEQVFVALKKLGVDTEMVRFPGEPHGLSREGRTDRRVARLNYILGWFDRYVNRDGEGER